MHSELKLPLGILLVLAAFGSGACRRSEMDLNKVTLTQVFKRTPKAHPPGPFAHVMPGMSMSEAQHADPVLMNEERPALWVRPGLSFHVQIDTTKQHIERTYIWMDDKDAKQAITSAWGAPIVGPNPSYRDKTIAHWYDPSAGLVADMTDEMGHTELAFYTYMPLEKLVGASGGGFGFERKKILGASFEEIKAAYSQWEAPTSPFNEKPERVAFYPPSSELGGTSVHVSLENGRATSYTVYLGYGAKPEAKSEIVALMKKRFGAGKTDSSGASERFSWGPDPEVVMKDADYMNAWSVDVKRTGS